MESGITTGNFRQHERYQEYLNRGGDPNSFELYAEWITRPVVKTKEVVPETQESSGFSTWVNNASVCSRDIIILISLSVMIIILVVLSIFVR